MGVTGDAIKAVIKRVPSGRVSSYGGVAAMAGLPNGARTVARVLHACSASEGLPWWRIVRSDGSIALGPGRGREEQLAALAAEGVLAERATPGGDARVELKRYGWFGGAD